MLIFVIAHGDEAKPIINHFKLKKQLQYTEFSVFTNKEVALIISGNGKVNAAAATVYIGLLCKQKSTANSLWVNIGVAGHQSFEVGSIWRVNKVIESTQGSSWYPIDLLTASSIKGHGLITVDEIQSCFSSDEIYDMECSGFYAMALRFSSIEFVHSLKVISDNENQPHQLLSREKMAQLIENKIDVITDTIKQLQRKLKQSDITFSSGYNDLINKIEDKYHLTYSQHKAIKELIVSFYVHNIEISELTSLTKDCNSGKKLIDLLLARQKNITLALDLVETKP